MWERRPMLGVLIGLTLCVSIWRISSQEPQINDYSRYAIVGVPTSTGGGVVGGATSVAFVNTQQNSQSINRNGDANTNGGDHRDNEIENITFNPPISLDQLAFNDATNLIDLNNFHFAINQKSCTNYNSSSPFQSSSSSSTSSTSSSSSSQSQQGTHTLILIHSAPNNWNKRNVIRETWGQLDPRSRIIFLLGAVDSWQEQRKLEQENELFHDIVQGNFKDAYRNMTYKHVMALKWFIYNCPDAKYLLKTDDDVFVNTPNVYEFLTNPLTDKRKFLFCYKVENARVSRSYRSKWRVSVKEYSERFYPTYCPGFSIIYSADTVFQLYKEAQKSDYFWIDDVYITGFMAEASKTPITKLGDYYLGKSKRRRIFDGYEMINSTSFVFTSPNLTEKEIRLLWLLVSSSLSSSSSTVAASSAAQTTTTTTVSPLSLLSPLS